MRRTAILSLLASALMAQAPAPAPAPAEDSVAAIQKLTETDPSAAYAKTKTLIAAPKPAFNKTNLETTQKSIEVWRGYLTNHSLFYNAAKEVGRWEEAKDAAVKARDMAKEMQAEAFGPFNDYKAAWAKASSDASKALEELATLKAKETRTPEEDSRVVFLQGNEATYKQYVSNAKIALSQVNGNLKNLEAQTKDYDGPIAQIEKRISDEKEEMIKFKGDKVKYGKALVAAVAKEVKKSKGKVANKAPLYNSLYRVLVLDPSNKDAQKQIDLLNGKAPAAPAKGKKK